MEKTLKPVLGDRFEAAREAIEHCQSLRRRRDQVRNTEDLRDLDKQIADVGQQAFELVFSVRMLDPAMGSGHFLVHGVNVITSNVMTFLGELGDNAISDRIQEMRQAILEDVESQGVRFVERDLAKLAEPNLVKRMVMKRCIFGVDLNPMAVELSKLSLWLDSFTIGAPLSFLDHHLRCGNSLIGVTFEEVESGIGETPRRRARGSQVLLFGSLFAEVFRAAQSMLELGSLTDVTWQEVQDSRRLYDQAKHRLEPFRRALDLWTAEAFGTRGSQGVLTHGGVISHLRDPEHMLLQHRELLRRAEDVAQRHRFFHWEIEFPEVYYERDQRRECPGFDVVIGNPPYVRIQEMESEAEKEWLRSALRGDVPRYISAFRNFDLYVPFIERAFSLCREGGHFCFIVPNKFFQAEYGERLRGILIGRKSLAKIVNFGHNQIFEGSSVTNYTCLLFLTAVPQNHVEYVEILPLDDVHRQLPEVLGLQGNARYLKSEEFLLDELSEEPWCFPVGVERVIQRKAHAAGLPLEDVVEDVIVGIQTSRDDVYILEYRGPSSNANLLSVYSKALDRTIELEKGVLKPLLSGDDVDRYGAPVANKCLLFPYRPNDEGEMELIHAETFRSDYPRTWRYLRENASVLRGRENGKMEGARWYAYVYPKNLDKQERPKLGVPRLVDRLKAFYDKHGQFYLDNVDVNGILFREGRSESHYYCLALINSRLMDYLFRQCSVRFRGDFYSANKQFIVRLPIRRIAFVTPSEVRSEVCTGGFRLVKDAVGAGAMSNILAWVNDRLSPRHSPDPGFAKKYEGDPIWHGWFGQVDGKWEQADVVHDLMAGLGERMEVLSRDIDAERSGFMRWLGQTIRSDLGQIVGLRGLPDYARVTPDELIRVLQTNQKRLQVDVSTRAFAERLATELATSQARLAPLLSEYDATDRLIDAVAYRLYGLDAEEITAIERAESMNATAEVDGYQ